MGGAYPLGPLPAVVFAVAPTTPGAVPPAAEEFPLRAGVGEARGLLAADRACRFGCGDATEMPATSDRRESVVAVLCCILKRSGSGLSTGKGASIVEC